LSVRISLTERLTVEANGATLDAQRFPGHQGRVVFAYLAVQEGRSVPRDELAEAIWGEELPATWEKALRVLMTKLRRLLEECGIDGSTGLTSAAGYYTLSLPPDTWIDVRAAARALEQAETALTAGDPDDARAQAETAASLCRPTFLPGEEGPWVEEQRRDLRDVLLRSLECLRDASLAAGEYGNAVRSATEITELEPFRESGYRRLMEAHVAAGNRAEALQVYERCRRLLAEELGAYPSPETESIYRSLLDTPSGRTAAKPSDATSASGAAPPPAGRRKRPALAAAGLVSLVVLVAAGTAIAVVATGGNGTRAPSAAGVPRIALVVPPLPLGNNDSFVAPYVAALARARSIDGAQTRTFTIDPSKPGLPPDVSRNIGHFGLVLLAAGLANNRFAHVIPRHPHTRFVVMDAANNHEGSLGAAVRKEPNATDVFFATGPTAFLAGYLSSFMGERGDPGKRQKWVSMIASDRGLNQNEVYGWEWGVATAAQGVSLLSTAYTNDASDPSVCERIANRQINEGSTTLYVDAGPTCSAGAISAAEDHDVWAIGTDPTDHGPQLLASTVKQLGQAANSVITSYLAGDLPHGPFDIGIERGAIALVHINHAVPTRIRAKLARVKQQNMSYWKGYATPQK